MLPARNTILCRKPLSSLGSAGHKILHFLQFAIARHVHSTNKAYNPPPSVAEASPVSSFANIISTMPGHRSRSSGRAAFPSPQIVSAESSLSKAVIKLWSLLEACLSHQKFDRALALIDSLYEITNTNAQMQLGAFMDAFNKYLFSWSQEPNVTLTDVEEFLVSVKTRYPNIAADGRSTAILMRAAIDKPPTVKNTFGSKKVDNMHYMRYINLWLKKGGDLSEVLRHIDVLTVVNLKKVVDEARIDLQFVPKEFRPLIRESLMPEFGISSKEVHQELAKIKQIEQSEHPDKIIISSDKKIDDSKDWTKELPPSLQKLGLDELKSVDSFGLKVIRHSLLALQFKSGQEFFDKFLSALENKDDFIDYDRKSVNFFKLYKSLRTGEQKKLFNDLLDEFNEDRERQLEARSIEGAEESWRHAAEDAKKRGGLMARQKDLKISMWKWYKDMLPLVQSEIKQCQEILEAKYGGGKKVSVDPSMKHLVDIAPFFTLVSAEKMTVITILELLRLSSTGGILDGMKSARAVLSVGKEVENEHRSESLLNSEEKAFAGISQGEKTQRLRRIIAKSRSSFRNSSSEGDVSWPQEIRAKIGSELISLLIRVARVTVSGIDPRTNKEIYAEAPAIMHTYQYSNGSRLGVLKLHKKLMHQLGSDDLHFSIFPQAFPMLNKPKEWTTWNDGGYHFSRNSVVRTKNSPEQTAYIKIASKRNDLDNIFKGLNVLGNTAWTINERILKILTQIWNTGEDFLAIPKEEKTPNIPPPPPRDAEPTAKRDWQRQARKIANKFGANRSLRCDTNYKLEIARALVGERFYFPHNLDFRGRTYPLSPHFNHLGNDLSRGLLIFWDGKELGPNGLRWLKVHLANLFGHSKMTFDDREKFVDDNFEKIKESVQNPMDKHGFWLEADDPWQALATMFEIVDALKLPDPAKFISYQPVHQDGTCNGLQHYAALGGDFEGATQVNLNPSGKPQDVYNFVAELTKKNLMKVDDEDARKLLKVMNRKIVKQTVMTNVYGVTYIGATHQIQKQLNDYFDSEESYRLSIYLTTHVFASIRELFTGAHQIQDWLSECAKRITKSVNVLDLDDEYLVNPKNGKLQHMSSVIWTTPLGLPVVQPYREENKKQIATNLQSVFISDPFEMNQVYSSRQVTAFAPNYIHSLDATHMLMSAIACGENNLTFASVHDSYWTHAASVDTMNKVLREQFVKLHSDNLIAKVKEEFENRFKGNLLVVTVPRSLEAAQKIIDFRTNFRKKQGRKLSLRDELILERRRLKFMTSNNPADNDNAKEMETSVSILSKDDIASLMEHAKNLKSHQTAKKTSSTIDSVSDSTNKNINVIVPFVCPEIPQRGEFDVNTVVESKYFFS